jgi:hypothetical protein
LTPRKGRVFIASGLDAADAAFATLYGAAGLIRMVVRADPVTAALESVDIAGGSRVVTNMSPPAWIASAVG